jgi:hypothetical protein
VISIICVSLGSSLLPNTLSFSNLLRTFRLEHSFFGRRMRISSLCSDTSCSNRLPLDCTPAAAADLATLRLFSSLLEAEILAAIVNDFAIPLTGLASWTCLL